MIIASFAAAVALFAAAPEAAAPAADAAKPATKRVCETVEVAGSNLPKKKCRDVPVKAETKPTEEAKAEAPKSQAPKSE